LLNYITCAQHSGNWRVTSYAFVLHWKEQVMHCKKLELDNLPSNQKLRILQNTVCEVADLSNVIQLSAQVVARGGTHLGFKEYLELLLSACPTYDKTHATPCSGLRNVYAANLIQDDDFYNTHDGCTYGVDTDVTDMLVHTTTMQFKGKPSVSRNYNSLFLPGEEWLKLSPENREEIIATRRNERDARFSGNPRQKAPVQRVNVHDTQEVVNIDDIIDYTANAFSH
jgi:hypothetical protein